MKRRQAELKQQKEKDVSNFYNFIITLFCSEYFNQTESNSTVFIKLNSKQSFYFAIQDEYNTKLALWTVYACYFDYTVLSYTYLYVHILT